MSTLFYKKRVQNGLSKDYVAKELNIPLVKYEMIEKGLMKMPTNKVDGFMQLLDKNNAIDVKLDNNNHNKEVEDYYNFLVSKKGDIFNINIKMKEFNVRNYMELSTLINVSPTLISRAIKQKRATYNTKSKLYEFFNDELNIQPKKSLSVMKETHKKIAEADRNMSSNDRAMVNNWWANFDLKKWMQDNNMTIRSMNELTGLSRGFFRNIVEENGGQRCFPSNLMKLKKSIEEFESNEGTKNNEEIKFPELPKVEFTNVIDDNVKTDVSKEIFRNTLDKINDKLMSKYNGIVQQMIVIGTDIDVLQNQLKAKEEEYDKLLEQKSIYSEILDDLRNEE